MRKFWITFWFYFKENFTVKSLMISGALFAAVIVVSFLINHFGGQYNDMAVVNNSSAFVVTGGEFADLTGWNVHFVDTEEAARLMLDEGYIDEIFVIEGDSRPYLRMITSGETMSATTELFISQLLMMQHIENVINSYELPLSAVSEITTPIESSFESMLDAEDGIAAIILGIIIPMVLYVLILMSGQGVASSVVSEKSSRVMELMMAKVHPTTTMLAKVLSFFGDIFVLFLSLGLGVVAANLLGFVNFGAVMEDISGLISVQMLLLSVIVVLLGYFMFIFMYAALGAVATSIESLNSMIGVITIAVMVPFFVAIFADLGSTLMNILVYVPVFSPFVIVQRFLRGYSSLIEVGVATVIMAACVVLSLNLAARINKNGMSHTSEKITFADVKKLLQK